MFQASTATEIDAAFATLSGQRPDALLVGSDPFYTSQAQRFAASAAQLGVAAIYPFRQFTAAGGLVSYPEPISLTRTGRQEFTPAAFSRVIRRASCR